MSAPSESKRKSIIVLASGRGSNFRALCEAVLRGRLAIKIEALISNVAGAGACQIARDYKIPVHEIPHAGHSRSEHEALVLAALKNYSPAYIVLAGYMRLFTPEFIRGFWDEKLQAARIVNVHPSLLPAFPGTDGYGQALCYGVKTTGVTVHLVGAGLDDGPIVLQKALDVRDDDTVASLTARGLDLEHELYVEALRRLFSESWSVTTGADTSLKDARPRVIFAGKVGG